MCEIDSTEINRKKIKPGFGDELTICNLGFMETTMKQAFVQNIKVEIRNEGCIPIQKFLELCENEFPMYLIDDLDPWQDQVMKPTTMFHSDKNSRKGNFVDDFISRNFFNVFIRIGSDVFDMQKSFRVITNLPTNTKHTKLISEEFEKIETIASKGENAETYLIENSLKTRKNNRANGLLRLVKPELYDLESGLLRSCAKMMSQNYETGAKLDSYIETIPFYSLLNIRPNEIILAFDEKCKAFGRAIMRKNLLDDFEHKNNRVEDGPEFERSEVYFIDYRYSKKIPWVKLYGLTEKTLNGVELQKKELEDEKRENELNQQIKTFKHPYSLDCTIKWESDEKFETEEKYVGLQNCFDHFNESLDWKNHVQIETYSIEDEPNAVYNCKIKIRFDSDNKILKEFSESLEEIVTNELTHELEHYNLSKMLKNSASIEDGTKKQLSSGYFSNSSKIKK